MLRAVSEAESPARSAAEHRVSVEDVRELMGASTPHFALQLRARIANLIRALDAGDPARVLGEREIRGGGLQDGQRPLPSLG